LQEWRGGCRRSGPEPPCVSGRLWALCHDCQRPVMTSDWRPTGTRAMLEQRAQLLSRARRFFADRIVLEVDTPAVVNCAVTDVHIHSARVDLTDRQPGAKPYFLHTSPEYAMKRLLAAG